MKEGYAMKGKRRETIIMWAIFLLPLLTFILEILPWGAILNFIDNPASELRRETYSYFSLMPAGYANFGPLLTGILTIVLLLLLITYLFTKQIKVLYIIVIVSFISVVTSLIPLILGLNFYSLIGLFISLTLIIESSCALYLYRLLIKEPTLG